MASFTSMKFTVEKQSELPHPIDIPSWTKMGTSVALHVADEEIPRSDSQVTISAISIDLDDSMSWQSEARKLSVVAVLAVESLCRWPLWGSVLLLLVDDVATVSLDTMLAVFCKISHIFIASL